MSNISYSAEFPGLTPEEALEDAEEAVKNLPFEPDWHHIGITRFYESATWRDADTNDQDELREKGWTWVATLKATG